MKYKDLIEKFAKEHHLEEKLKDLYPLLETYDHRIEMFEILRTDAQIANNAISSQPSDQYSRRTAIRATFAMIDGYLNIMNQNMLDSYKTGLIQLTTEEIEKLNETRTKNGKLHPVFMPLSKRLVFSFGIFARKLGGFEYPIDTTSDEWKQFKNAILVRNRLMHPRKLEDMMVETSEIRIVISVSTWYLKLFTALLDQVNGVMTKKSMEQLINTRIREVQSRKAGPAQESRDGEEPTGSGSGD